MAWLAQSGGDPNSQLWQELDIDQCLKLSTLVRACGLGGSGGFGAADSGASWEAGDLAPQGDEQPIDGVGYVAVSGLPGAAAVRVEGAAFDDGDVAREAFDVTVDLVPGPSAEGGIAVVPHSLGFEPWCPQGEDPPWLSSCIRVLDAAGNEIASITMP